MQPEYIPHQIESLRELVDANGESFAVILFVYLRFNRRLLLTHTTHRVQRAEVHALTRHDDTQRHQNPFR